MTLDPNAPTTPADLPAGDQGTGPGNGLDTQLTVASDAPASAQDQQTGTSDPEQLFTDEEISSETSPEVQERMRGMVAKYTRTQQAMKSKLTELADLVSRVEREHSARQVELSRVDGVPAQAGAQLAPPAVNEDQEFADVLQGLDPAGRTFLEKYGKALERKLEKRFEPIARGAAVARTTAELTAVRSKYPDFDRVVSADFARQVYAQSPGASLEQMYRLAKYDSLSGELSKAKQELGRYQMAQKRQAVTERPSGPAMKDLDFAWYEKLPKEERMNLSSREIAQFMEKHSSRV